MSFKKGDKVSLSPNFFLHGEFISYDKKDGSHVKVKFDDFDKEVIASLSSIVSAEEETSLEVDGEKLSPEESTQIQEQ